MTSLENLFGWPSGWGNFQEDLSAWDTSSVTNIHEHTASGVRASAPDARDGGSGEK